MPDPASLSRPGTPSPPSAPQHGSDPAASAPGPGGSFRDVLRGVPGGESSPAPAGEAPWALVRRAVHGIGRSQHVVDRAVRAARRGHVFDHGELLALQAGVYRHAQQVELASKLVDKSTSAVRNVLSSQQ